MRKSLALIAGALIGAAAVTAVNGYEPLDRRVLRLQTEQALPALADELARWPTPVQRVFLAYAGDEELVLNARLGLLQHPALAPRILSTYGNSAAFRQILRRFGANVFPPIAYFMDHEITTLWLSETLSGWLDDADATAGPSAGVEGDGRTQRVASQRQRLTPERRGWYAMAFIHDEGHDFLGQFVTDDRGQVHWIQTERAATGAKRFFTSGLTALETKYRLGQERSAGDYGWAAVDVLAPIAALKVLRLGKGGASAARTARATRVGTTTARAARIGKLTVAAGAVAGTAWVVTHPSVIGSIGGELSQWLGLPRWLGSVVLWFLLLLPALILLRFAYRWLLRPAIFLIATSARAMPRPQR